MLDCKSRQPLMIVSPLKSISQVLLWNQTSHAASQRTDTERRLFIMPGARWASRAAFGSFGSRSSKVFVVNIRAPEGWMIVLVGSCGQFSLAGAPSTSRETFSAESTKAVKFRLVGFWQPGWRIDFFGMILLILGSMTLSSILAGLTRHLLDFQFLLH